MFECTFVSSYDLENSFVGFDALFAFKSSWQVTRGKTVIIHGNSGIPGNCRPVSRGGKLPTHTSPMRNLEATCRGLSRTLKE